MDNPNATCSLIKSCCYKCPRLGPKQYHTLFGWVYTGSKSWTHTWYLSFMWFGSN